MTVTVKSKMHFSPQRLTFLTTQNRSTPRAPNTQHRSRLSIVITHLGHSKQCTPGSGRPATETHRRCGLDSADIRSTRWWLLKVLILIVEHTGRHGGELFQRLVVIRGHHIASAMQCAARELIQPGTEYCTTVQHGIHEDGFRWNYCISLLRCWLAKSSRRIYCRFPNARRAQNFFDCGSAYQGRGIKK